MLIVGRKKGSDNDIEIQGHILDVQLSNTLLFYQFQFLLLYIPSNSIIKLIVSIFEVLLLIFQLQILVQCKV